MTDFDPYQILGVARSAPPVAVKAAYRKRVQTAHPDRGGSHDEFVTIVKAFGLLSDPDARRLFDETGLVDHDGIRNYRQDMAVILADMFDAAVQTAMEAGLKLPSVNFTKTCHQYQYGQASLPLAPPVACCQPGRNHLCRPVGENRHRE